MSKLARIEKVLNTIENKPMVVKVERTQDGHQLFCSPAVTENDLIVKLCKTTADLDYFRGIDLTDEIEHERTRLFT